MEWTLVSERLPEGKYPTYPPPYSNRTYDKYLVTDGFGNVMFAYYIDIGRQGNWQFVNPFNHRRIKNVYAWLGGQPVKRITKKEIL